jgi:hypothetical protein
MEDLLTASDIRWGPLPDPPVAGDLLLPETIGTGLAMNRREMSFLLTSVLYALREARGIERVQHEAVVVTLELLRERTEELASSRRTSQELRAELRRYVGRVVREGMLTVVRP